MNRLYSTELIHEFFNVVVNMTIIRWPTQCSFQILQMRTFVCYFIKNFLKLCIL